VRPDLPLIPPPPAAARAAPPLLLWAQRHAGARRWWPGGVSTAQPGPAGGGDQPEPKHRAAKPCSLKKRRPAAPDGPGPVCFLPCAGTPTAALVAPWVLARQFGDEQSLQQNLSTSVANVAPHRRILARPCRALPCRQAQAAGAKSLCCSMRWARHRSGRGHAALAIAPVRHRPIGPVAGAGHHPLRWSSRR